MLNPDAIWLLDDKIERPDGDRYEQTRNCEQICRKNKKGESESREEYNGIGKWSIYRISWINDRYYWEYKYD